VVDLQEMLSKLEEKVDLQEILLKLEEKEKAERRFNRG